MSHGLLDNLIRWSVNAASFSVLLPFIVALSLYRVLDRRMKIVLIYLVISAAIELFLYIMTTQRVRFNNLPLLHVYTVIQFVLLAMLYRDVVQQMFPKYVWETTVIAFIVFAAVNAWLWQPLTGFNGYARAAESVLLISMAMCSAFYLMFREKQLRPLGEMPMFWVNAAILFYFPASFFVFLLSNDVLVLSSKVFRISWAFHALFLILHYLFLTIALWSQHRQMKSMSLSSAER
jgi:hypothetical protein